MSMTDLTQKTIPVLKKYGVAKAAVFGSYARGEAKNNSDIDLLVEIKKNLSLLDFSALKQELQELLNRRVDLIEYSQIKPMLKQSILENAKVFYTQ
ncbi:nucleotidyltransferase family protein [Patescibacteria group bacterium]|nr:nucleotidyltransferase family protein [Patescibacteria group bacterium]